MLKARAADRTMLVRMRFIFSLVMATYKLFLNSPAGHYQNRAAIMWVLTPIRKENYQPDTSGTAYKYVWVWRGDLASYT